MSWKDPLDDGYSSDRIDAMDGSFWGSMVVFMLFLGGIVLWAYLAWTPNTDKATQILREEGYTEIRITGADPMKCGEGDLGGTKFRAKNQAGNTVSGVVCCGAIFKGCTIRR